MLQQPCAGSSSERSARDVRGLVLTYFETKFGLPAHSPETLSGCYLGEGAVDSMGLVELVEDLEELFGIRFQSDDMQSSLFVTVGGLIKLIEKRIRSPLEGGEGGALIDGTPWSGAAGGGINDGQRPESTA